MDNCGENSNLSFEEVMAILAEELDNGDEDGECFTLEFDET